LIYVNILNIVLLLLNCISQNAYKYIVKKLSYWIDEVRNEGLSTVRKIPGYHDEPLKGARVGQRSIRLNRSYRAIYEIDQSDVVHFIAVLEVNKHEY